MGRFCRVKKERVMCVFERKIGEMSRLWSAWEGQRRLVLARGDD